MKENRAFGILFITKKQTGFAWNFLETPIQNVQRCFRPLFQHTLFLVFPIFQKYLNPQVRNNKMAFPILALQNQPQRYILSYFFKLLRALSFYRILVEFSLTCIFHHVWEKVFDLWCSQSQFSPPESGGENYDLLYQNSIRKYEDDLEHQVIYILHDL